MIKNCVLCAANQDERIIFQNKKWRVILIDDALYPGFCRVIWQDHIAEMTDLPNQDRQELFNVVLLVERAVRDVMNPDKINLASLGNMVPHLHWHIIPRFVNDSHFPESIWGVKQREPDLVSLSKRKTLLQKLEARIRQVLES